LAEKNLHTAKLFEYLFFAPYNIQKKFYNFHGAETMNKFYDHYGDCSFMGILFYQNKVYCHNIEIYSLTDDHAHRYLEITNVFNELLKEFNIFHLCYLIHRATYKYYRENTLTEKILDLIKFQTDERYKPKFTYAVTKHRGRYRLFVESYQNENQGEWDRILLSAIRKDLYYSRLIKYSKQRPDLFNGVYSELPELNTITDKHDKSKSLRQQVKKRRKLNKGNIQRRRLFRRSNTNFKLK
jgi:hypothetical protein